VSDGSGGGHDNAALRAAVVDRLPKSPFIALLCLRVEVYEPDAVIVRLPFRDDLTNDGSRYHGGVIASVLDTSGSLAAWSNHDFSNGARGSTIDLSIQYVGACRKSDLVCRASTVRRGRELIFVDVAAEDSDGNVVAKALMTYRIVR